MTATEIVTVDQPINRDRWGRPYIVRPDGGKPVPYTRATTVAGSTDDMWGLMRWKQRQTAIGLADRKDLLLAVTTHRDDKKRLDDLCEQALEASASSAAATTGTALHSLTEYVDRGEEPPTVGDDVKRLLDAYRRITEPFEVVAMEQMMVLDDYQIAGTPDRIVRWGGQHFIADLKTGKSLDYSQQKIAAQLAIYSRGVGYDHTTGKRIDLPDVHQRAALVFHVPASGSEQPAVHWIDIGRGWEIGVDLCRRVREWRKTSDLLAPFNGGGS